MEGGGGALTIFEELTSPSFNAFLYLETNPRTTDSPSEIFHSLEKCLAAVVFPLYIAYLATSIFCSCVYCIRRFLTLFSLSINSKSFIISSLAACTSLEISGSFIFIGSGKLKASSRVRFFFITHDELLKLLKK